MTFVSSNFKIINCERCITQSQESWRWLRDFNSSWSPFLLKVIFCSEDLIFHSNGYFFLIRNLPGYHIISLYFIDYRFTRHIEQMCYQPPFQCSICGYLLFMEIERERIKWKVRRAEKYRYSWESLTQFLTAKSCLNYPIITT